MAVAPDFDFATPRPLRLGDFPADRSRRLFAAPRPGAERAVDVVVARDSGPKLEILAKVAAHPLAEQLFPPIAVLRHRGVGVFLLEGYDGGRHLLVGVVDAC